MKSFIESKFLWSWEERYKIAWLLINLSSFFNDREAISIELSSLSVDHFRLSQILQYSLELLVGFTPEQPTILLRLQKSLHFRLHLVLLFSLFFINAFAYSIVSSMHRITLHSTIMSSIAGWPAALLQPTENHSTSLYSSTLKSKSLPNCYHILWFLKNHFPIWSLLFYLQIVWTFWVSYLWVLEKFSHMLPSN